MVLTYNEIPVLHASRPPMIGQKGSLRLRPNRAAAQVLLHGAFVSSGAAEGGGAYRTDRAYSVGVMPNFSLNWREKWCTVEYCRAAAISVKFRLFSRIICLLSWSLMRRMYESMPTKNYFTCVPTPTIDIEPRNPAPKLVRDWWGKVDSNFVRGVHYNFLVSNNAIMFL